MTGVQTCALPIFINASEKLFDLGIQAVNLGCDMLEEHIAFVDVVREAATNAAKHGQAHRVDVSLGESPGYYTLSVQNDGAAARGEVHEGTGFPSMRRALARVGGTLSIVSTSPFTIEAQAPCAPLHEGEDQ